MIFCGYKTPGAIVKLKDQKEVAKMFNTVIELEELIPGHERDQMFRIFRRNPSLLKILPGMEPEFQNFVQKVENLLPGKTSTKKRPVSKAISNEAKPTGKNRPSEADLTERLRRWFQKELPARAVDASIEIAMSTFTFKENANGSFTFNCLKCKTPCVIPNAEPTKPTFSLGKSRVMVILLHAFVLRKQPLRARPHSSFDKASKSFAETFKFDRAG